MLTVTRVESRVAVTLATKLSVVTMAIAVLATVPGWTAVIMAGEKVVVPITIPLDPSVPIMVFINMVVPNEMAMEVNFHIAGLDHGGRCHARRDECCQRKPRNQASYTHNGPPV